MRKIFIIGIGAGNPDYLTIQAVNALNDVDVFFMPDKGTEKAALRQRRLDICARFIKDKSYRIVDVTVPKRNTDFADYAANVVDWHAQIEARYEELLARELGADECGGFLIWGDPTLYDSTLRIIEKIHARGQLPFEYEIVPGISAAQALAARHRIALNRIGEPVHITTGRKLAEGFSGDDGSAVVFLDGEQTFQRLADQDLDIYWGAYLGTEDEILIAGQLSEVKDEIAARRAKARAKNGWIMDIYLLRKSET